MSGDESIGKRSHESALNLGPKKNRQYFTIDIIYQLIYLQDERWTLSSTTGGILGGLYMGYVMSMPYLPLVYFAWGSCQGSPKNHLHMSECQAAPILVNDDR